MSEQGHDADGPDRNDRAPYAVAARSLLRETILRATDDLVAVHPWSEVTMAQVAQAAGVSRQTVYNEFGSRSELAVAYAAWAGDQLLDEVERCVAEHRDDLQEACVAAFTVFLDLGAGHPLVRALGASTGAESLAAVIATAEGQPIVAGATERLSSIITSTWPDLPVDLVPIASEVLVRLAVSHLIQPAGRPEDAAAHVAVVLGPFLAQLQADAPT